MFQMSRYGGANLDCKIYVGDLPRDASEKDIERAFSYYGPLKSVWVARNPPGFAFVEFDDRRDAEDAVRGLDGTYVYFNYNHKIPGKLLSENRSKHFLRGRDVTHKPLSSLIF